MLNTKTAQKCYYRAHNKAGTEKGSAMNFGLFEQKESNAEEAESER